MLLRVGTDYSGIETPILALQQLRIPYKHIFSSEIDPAAREVIKTRFNPEKLFGDATERNSEDLASIDLYVAGFPCQEFSRARFSSSISRDKLRHFRVCVRAIRTCKPKIFILENVLGIRKIDGGSVLQAIKKSLVDLGDYHVSILKLNARDFGSPQNRVRLFFVGIRSDLADGPLLRVYPSPGTKQLTFEDDIYDPRSYREKLNPKRMRFFRMCAKRHPDKDFLAGHKYLECHMSNNVPCLITRGGIYWAKKDLVTSVREDCRLQGIPDSFSFPKHMGTFTCRRLIGNAMSIDCLKGLIYSSLKYIQQHE